MYQWNFSNQFFLIFCMLPEANGCFRIDKELFFDGKTSDFCVTKLWPVDSISLFVIAALWHKAESCRCHDELRGRLSSSVSPSIREFINFFLKKKRKLLEMQPATILLLYASGYRFFQTGNLSFSRRLDMVAKILHKPVCKLLSGNCINFFCVKILVITHHTDS